MLDLQTYMTESPHFAAYLIGPIGIPQDMEWTWGDVFQVDNWGMGDVLGGICALLVENDTKIQYSESTKRENSRATLRTRAARE